MPDIIFMALHKNYFIFHFPIYKELLALLLLSFLILAVQKYWLRLSFALFIALLSFAQLMHFSYFHSFIMPYEIAQIDQVAEILDTLSDILRYTYLPILIFIVQVVFLALFLKKASSFKIPYIALFIALLLLIGPISAAKRDRAYIYMPKSTSLSFKNTYNALSWYLAKVAFKQKPHKKFKPYQVIDLNTTSPHNIIVVMGESLSAKEMSLFGYPKKTTPHLDKLKNAPNFRYTWGYSGGISTDVAVPSFFTLKREPQNIAPIATNKTNLLRLAKQKGYTTHYITTQTLFIIGGVLADFADHTKVYKGYDQLLVDYLDKIDWNKKNFIVLHQRNSHSPYEKYTPSSFAKFVYKNLPFKEYMQGSYCNSICYTDFLLGEIFKKVDSQKKCTVVFFTPDHAELIGRKDEKGKFGHGFLEFEDTKVPMIIYYNSACSKEITKNFDLKNVISHYQFAKIIAKTLGYNIINPNEDGSYYINGLDISGSSGFLRYTKKGKLQ